MNDNSSSLVPQEWPPPQVDVKVPKSLDLDILTNRRARSDPQSSVQ